MSTKTALAGVVLAALALSGCDQARKAFGIAKQSPDEFAVVSRAPLSLPPDFDLRPPRPGAKRPQETAPPDAARGALAASATGRSGTAPAGSPAEKALLARAGAENPDPGIRARLDREASVLASGDEGFVDRLIFWRGGDEPGDVVDPAAEARRLEENAALGKPPTSGRTPRIERRPKGWLEDLFR